ncbi:MAG: NTP transferase domain-containing protein, partial [Alphaproteobacteria bacterium]
MAIFPSAAIRALVPVKRLTQAKLRLAPHLPDAMRQGLAVAMLTDVLDMLSNAAGLSGTAVVTGDPEIAALGRRRGARIIHDAEETGTNAAVRCGHKAFAAEGVAGALVVPADIPFL